MSITGGKRFGAGKLFWLKTLECYNPKGPLNCLTIGEEFLFETMTFIAWDKQDWLIESSPSYLFVACRGRLSLRSIKSHLKALCRKGFVQGEGMKRGKTYLINPLLMNPGQAMTLPNFAIAASLVVKPDEAPVEKPHMTRDEQLRIAKELAGSPG